jgi:hypothetical protein
VTVTAGYSGKRLIEKLGLKPGGRLLVLDPPEHYAALVEPLPEGAALAVATWGEPLAPAAILHAFVRSKAELEARAVALAAAPPPGGILWISWPKKASPLFQDLTEDGVRAALLPTGWVDVKVAAVDADWSGLKFLRRRA